MHQVMLLLQGVLLRAGQKLRGCKIALQRPITLVLARHNTGFAVVTQAGDDSDPFAEADERDRRRSRELLQQQRQSTMATTAAQVWGP